MKILITGAAGFTATHLAKLLAGKSDPVSAPNELFFTSLRTNKPKYCTHYIPCDLSKFESVNSLISSIRPDQIYHLAGSFTNDYALDYAANVSSTKNILDSLLHSGISAKILLIGSAAEYGAVEEEENPIAETHPLKPISIYGLTKLLQTQLMDYYYRMHQINIVMARTFNIFGRGMSSRLFLGRIYEQIDKYKRQEISKIAVGNLKNKRDYLDIKDTVKYYQAIMARGLSGEIYNVGSGKSIRIDDLLAKILDEAGLVHDVVEEQIYTANKQYEVADIYADMSKTKAIEAHRQNTTLRSYTF
jgi:nucleoside-diphosphate-sugar epimerase